MKYRQFLLRGRAAIALCVSITFLGFLLFMPKSSTAAAKYGLALCGEIVIPSLFPFAVATAFINSTNIVKILCRLLELPSRLLFRAGGGVGTIFLLSAIGGYPIGARLISEAHERGMLDSRSASLLLTFCVNGGPAFIVTAVGAGMLSSKKAGVILLVASLGSAMLTGALSARIIGFDCSELRTSFKSQPVSEALVGAVCSAGSSVFGICCFVIFFSVVSACVSELLPHGCAVAASLILEVTGGALSASSLGITAVAAVLGWSGLAVHFQIFMLSKSFRPSIPIFYAGRAINAALTALLAFVIEGLFPITEYTSTVNTASVRAGSLSASSIALLAMSLVMMLWSSCLIDQKQAGRRGLK